VKFQGAVYAFHAFQKKYRKGITTPKADIDLINARLKSQGIPRKGRKAINDSIKAEKSRGNVMTTGTFVPNLPKVFSAIAFNSNS